MKAFLPPTIIYSPRKCKRFCNLSIYFNIVHCLYDSSIAKKNLPYPQMRFQQLHAIFFENECPLRLGNYSRIAYNSVLKRTSSLRIIRCFSILDCVFAKLRIIQFGREPFLSGLYAVLRGWIAFFTSQRIKRTSPVNFVRCPARLNCNFYEPAYKEKVKS